MRRKKRDLCNWFNLVAVIWIIVSQILYGKHLNDCACKYVYLLYPCIIYSIYYIIWNVPSISARFIIVDDIITGTTVQHKLYIIFVCEINGTANADSSEKCSRCFCRMSSMKETADKFMHVRMTVEHERRE